MEDISKYISDSVVKKLHEKGKSRQEIETSIEKFIQEREKLGYEGDELIASVKLRVMGAYKNILRSNLLSVKGIVFGMGKVSDNNKRLMYLSKLKEGESGFKPNLNYKVKEGEYPWGNNQGELISEEADYEQSGFIGIQYKNALHLKNFKLTGDWVKNKEANNATSGDVINLQLDPKNLSNDNIFINSYKVNNKLTDEKYKQLLGKELIKFNKSIKETIDENHNGLVIIKASVGDIEKLKNGAFRFDLVDESTDWSEDYSMNATMSEEDVSFIEGAMDVIFIGDTYSKKNEPGFGLNVYNTIVPDKFKKIELSKEMKNEISNNLDEEFGEAESNEDLDELL